MQQVIEQARRGTDVLRIGVALLGLAVAGAGLIDRFLFDLPIGMPDGQNLFWYAATAAVACWGCR
jgi:hypothetical protein